MVAAAGNLGQSQRGLLVVEVLGIERVHQRVCVPSVACGQLIRLDPGVGPTTFRCATVSQDELVSLRSIENVIRLGRVTRIGPDQIKLADGSIPADRGQVHVDCSAAGLRTKPARPVFGGGLITLQQIRACQPVFSAALTGYVEAIRDDDAQQNLICPANEYSDTAADWIPLTCTAQRAEITWVTDPDVSAWMQRSRLNATCGIADHQADPRMQAALTRVFTYIEPAISKLETPSSVPAAGNASITHCQTPPRTAQIALSAAGSRDVVALTQIRRS